MKRQPAKFYDAKTPFFIFPDTDALDEVELQDIITFLPKPISTRRTKRQYKEFEPFQEPQIRRLDM